MEVKKVQEKKPEFRTIGPIWWHHHGTKMKLKVLGIRNDFLVIQGSAAEVVITKAPDGWFVSWKIRHGFNTGVSGKAWFASSDLARAFGLRNDIPKFGEWLIQHPGGTTGKQHCFIRYKEFLNIPCPGTGHDGDPNVSIELSEEIKKAIEQLIENQKLII